MISNLEFVFCCIHDMMMINQNQEHFWTYITLVVWDEHLDQSIRSAADMNVIQRNPTDGRNFMTNVIKRVVIHQYREIGNHLEIWEQFWDKCWCHKPLCSKIEEKTTIWRSASGRSWEEFWDKARGQTRPHKAFSSQTISKRHCLYSVGFERNTIFALAVNTHPHQT